MKISAILAAILITAANLSFAAEIKEAVSTPESGKAINQLINEASKSGQQVLEDLEPVQPPEEQNASATQPGLSPLIPESHQGYAGAAPKASGPQSGQGNSADLTGNNSNNQQEFRQNTENSVRNSTPDNTGQDVFPPQAPDGKPGHKESFWGKIRRFFGYTVIAFNAAIGHIQDTLINPLPSVNVISEKVIQAVTGHTPSMVGEERFISEFEKLTNSRFTDNNHVKFLAGGPESFPIKDRLMRQARKGIYVTSYSFHDDITGHETANILAEKKRQGLDVKVITDYKVAYSYGNQVFPVMSAGGVEILYYRELNRRGDFWHTKMLIADDEYAIVGGMNYGDPYSHKDPDGEKWRDFDVLYSGPAVLETKKIFTKTWNSKIEEEALPLNRIDAAKAENQDFEPGNARIAVVFQDPPDNSYVLMSILKGIYGARYKVNIVNSYFIAIPAIRQAIVDARKRGVEVNILTNSSKSIDKESRNTVIPIIRSLAQIYDSGINIYFSQDVNLHGKFMTVDGVYANIGSYNLHPRGERYDTELNVSIIDGDSVSQLDAVFKQDISRAKKAAREDLAVPASLRSMVSYIIEYFFFTLL